MSERDDKVNAAAHRACDVMSQFPDMMLPARVWESVFALRDALKAPRPSSTGSADGDARDHHGGGSLDQPATESRRTVGAVVEWVGLKFIVVAPGEGDKVMRDIAIPNDVLCQSSAKDEFLRWATREECERHGIPYVERGTPAPVAPAIDREGLEQALIDAVASVEDGLWIKFDACRRRRIVVDAVLPVVIARGAR